MGRVISLYIIRNREGRMVGEAYSLIDAHRWANRIGGTFEIAGKEHFE